MNTSARQFVKSPGLVLCSVVFALVGRARREERGEIPQWVVMAALGVALVVALFAILGPKLQQWVTAINFTSPF